MKSVAGKVSLGGAAGLSALLLCLSARLYWRLGRLERAGRDRPSDQPRPFNTVSKINSFTFLELSAGEKPAPPPLHRNLFTKVLNIILKS